MKLEHEVHVDASREEIWELLADPSGYGRFMAGVTRFKSHDEGEFAVGSRFTVHMRVGSADVGGEVEIVELDEPSDIAWTSVLGIDQRGRWRLRGDPEGGTRVMFRLSYGAPGGFLGALSDRVGKSQVQQNVRRTVENVKTEIEGGARVSEGKGRLAAVVDKVGDVRILAGAGLVRPVRPDRLARVGTTLVRWGRSPAAGYISGAVLAPDRRAIVDELGTLSFAEVNDRTNRLTNALASEGVKQGDGVAIMARNHRGFVEATVATAKLGAHALLMNTAFSAPQLAEVAEREDATALVYDEEFAELVEKAGEGRRRYVAWHEEGESDDPTLEDLIESASDAVPKPPSETGRTVILTSGTTGTPKGANRASPSSLAPAISLLSKIPLTEGHTAYIAAPLFHSWGFAHFTIGLLLHSTLVLRHRFDPEETLKDIEKSEAESLVVVPVMMQRILALDEETRKRYDTSSLKVVAASGSALPGDLATKWMDEFGDTLYNLYGSTEVAWASIAQPSDMRAAPGTAGKPPRGTIVRLYDEHGNEVPRGETGRIFVGNEMLFEGYTGGGTKDEIDGLMATGDVGRMDDAGRLFVEGRDDEMIVSGGENVFPKEVEDLLANHEAVSEAAALGVDDEEFGKRLRAFVVLKDGEKAGEDDLKAYVKENLARYKVPREIWFLDELPRNATGKVLKRELKEIEEAPK